MPPLSGAGVERILYRGTNTPFGLSKDRPWVLTSTLRAGKYAEVAIPAQGGNPVPILTDAVQPAGAQFSPDGRWIVYSALVQGKRQIFVSTMPKELGGPSENAGAWQVSQQGGDQPVWRGDGTRFLIPLMPPGQNDEYSIGFIQNWPKLFVRPSRAPEPE